MWEDVAVALACTGFVIAFAVVALELWTMGRLGELTGRGGTRPADFAPHPEHAPERSRPVP
ncbi:hypothetical protein ACFQ34_12960 [Pseudonocardia benzenivorans]|uniref:Uncharacterized protein n=2 Tax=Pseudonocardia TaxID=1847 RepID=F4CUC2_PSEUX|nr:hypothetical protein [Pseudonocardia dioxanivorans]AEA24581.1 hypothetical protein Psed_2375 [Pseudonocardia dioxanivorans CB1190]GJF04712.1 hypothetical protein PSD17_36660 [Pseudonocardia sp. D17]